MGEIGYNSKAYEDFLLCAGASYFTAAFSLDFYLSGTAFTAGRFFSLGLMIFCWAAMSYKNGRKKRTSFAAAAFIFNTGLPLLEMLCAAVPSLKFSRAGLVIKDISTVLNEFPYYEAESRLNIGGSYFSAVLGAVCLLIFAAGHFSAGSEDEAESDKIQKGDKQ